jgi:hypothetical protein
LESIAPGRRRVRRAASHPSFLGIWSFTKSKPAAKSLLAHLSQPKAIEKMVARAEYRSADLFPGPHNPDDIRHMQGEPLEKTLALGEGEVEGYLRM